MRTPSVIILAMTILFGCNKKPDQTAAIRSNEALVKQYFAHFDNHNWGEMTKMYTETAEFKDPSFGPGIVKQTRQQTADKYAALAGTFPDIHDDVRQIYPSGERHVVVEFVSTGTAPDGSKFELPVCTIFTIEGGKISKDFTYYDNFESADSTKN